MDKKIIIGLVVIVFFLVMGFLSFMDSKIEYANFETANSTNRTCQVKGTLVKEDAAYFDAENNQFIFYMIDEQSQEMKVVLEGARPNNFEMAETIVAKGKVNDGYFHANSVLTKCPSKYEGTADEIHNSVDKTKSQ